MCGSSKDARRPVIKPLPAEPLQIWQTSTAGADTPERVYSEDATTALSDFTVDGDGAVLFQVQDVRNRWVRDPNNTPSCPFSERFGYCFHYEDDVQSLRLARVNGASVSTRTLDTGDGPSYYGYPLKLVGDEHTAFLQYESEMHAIDTRTLSTKWIVPADGCCLTAMRDGGVAIAGYDGIMRAVNSGGSVTALGPMSQFGAEQTALGLWVGPSLTGGQATLTSKFGVPLDPSIFSNQVGSGGRQRRNNPEFLVFASADEAALKAMDSIEPITFVTGHEWGGKICKQDNLYRWSRFVTSHSRNLVDVNALASCEPLGTTWGRFHTHPPVENSNPSGPDLAIADGLPAQVFYLLSPMPFSPVFPPVNMHRLRFRNVPPNPAGSNVCKRTNGVWVPYVPGAVCSSHLP